MRWYLKGQLPEPEEKTTPKWALVAVALAFLLLHWFMFRDVVAEIPAIVSGNSVVVREELVPFFEINEQFFGENTAVLTNSEEVRVAYSFWTAWVRHHAVLPFALVIMNTLSAFLLFYAFYRLARYFARDQSWIPVIASAVAAFLIHFMLLYAKIAHFYTLILGFAMFALALSLVLEWLFFRTGQHSTRRNTLTVSALVLFNPAIHYHIIFYLTLLVLLAFHVGLQGIINRAKVWSLLRQNAKYLGWIVLLSGVPYVLYLLAVSDVGSTANQIPVNYWTIYYTSVALPFIFSFDIAGHLDLYFYGDYLAPTPRIVNMALFLLIGLFLISRAWGRARQRKDVFLLTVVGAMLVAIWMALGYASGGLLTFHELLSRFAMMLAATHTFIDDSLERLLAVFINVLRFPHRFQFMYFYMGGILMTMALMWLYGTVFKKTGKILVSIAVMLCVGFLPLLSPEYRAVLLSGDMAGFLKPYAVPDDLRNIKAKLQAQDNDRLFVLPTLESGREIVAGNTRYSFLDKFYIYYLNQPTLYYGVGGDPKNKIISYVAYRAIADDEPWWDTILAQSLGVTDILYPKHVQDRANGLTYMKEVGPKIEAALQNSTLYEKSYDGADYVLYTLRETPAENPNVLIDMQWNELLQYFESRQPAITKLYFPLQLSTYIKQTDTQLVTDSLERSFYNLYLARNPTQRFYPNMAQLPFNDQLVASSNFTNNALSLETLRSSSDAYNYLNEELLTLTNLQSPQFIGVPAGTSQQQTIEVQLNAQNSGEYRVLVHMASRLNEVEAWVDGHPVTLRKIADDQNKHNESIDFTYFYADTSLGQGPHTLSMQSSAKEAIAIEMAGIVPADIVPESFDSITAPFTITPTEQQNTYNVGGIKQ